MIHTFVGFTVKVNILEKKKYGGGSTGAKFKALEKMFGYQRCLSFYLNVLN